MNKMSDKIPIYFKNKSYLPLLEKIALIMPIFIAVFNTLTNALYGAILLVIFTILKMFNENPFLGKKFYKTQTIALLSSKMEGLKNNINKLFNDLDYYFKAFQYIDRKKKNFVEFFKTYEKITLLYRKRADKLWRKADLLKGFEKYYKKEVLS